MQPGTRTHTGHTLCDLLLRFHGFINIFSEAPVAKCHCSLMPIGSFPLLVSHREKQLEIWLQDVRYRSRKTAVASIITVKVKILRTNMALLEISTLKLLPSSCCDASTSPYLGRDSEAALIYTHKLTTVYTLSCNKDESAGFSIKLCHL